MADRAQCRLLVRPQHRMYYYRVLKEKLEQYEREEEQLLGRVQVN